MADDLDELTKKELKERARQRDLSVSGTKDELVDRLRESSSSAGASAGSETGGGVDGVRSAVEAAQNGFGALNDSEVDSIVGVSNDEGDWTVRLRVVEMRRIPPSSDIVATFDVTVDGDDGELKSFEQVARSRRDEVER